MIAFFPKSPLLCASKLKCTTMLKFLKNWTLPIAMLVGAVGYPLFISLSFLTPYLIFTMLLLTFCKVSPRDLKPKPLHMWLLLIQIGGALAAYLLLYRFDKIVAEGVMVCIICPTATAAAVGRECGQSDYLYIDSKYRSGYCCAHSFSFGGSPS